MSRDVVRQLIDRWVNEPAFRDAICKDPENAVRCCGAELDEEEWIALRNWHCIGQKQSERGYPLFFWYEFLPCERYIKQKQPAALAQWTSNLLSFRLLNAHK